MRCGLKGRTVTTKEAGASSVGLLLIYECQPDDERLAFKHSIAGSRHGILMMGDVVRMTTRARPEVGGRRA